MADRKWPKTTAPPVPRHFGLDMLCPDSKEHSAELLRQAIPLMAQQPAPLHPITYAVWHDHLAGRNPDQRAEIDAARRRQVPLGDDMVRALYRRHMLDAAADVTHRVSDGLRAVIDEVGHSAAQTGERVSEFSASLQETGGRIASLGTRDTGASLATLSRRLQSATAELEQLRAELDLAKRQATMDSLTGATNRRGFDESLAALLLDHPADDPGPSVMLIDLDHFKRINDQFGHVFGDTVLKSVALAIRSCVKGRGHREERIGTITVSLGVSSWRPGESMEALIERAEQALYRSKREGRNRVTAGE